MMTPRKHHWFPLLCITLVVCSVVVGWLIPSFYLWTDSDQSRPSPLLWKVPLTMTIAGVFISLTLPWLPLPSANPSEPPKPKVQFPLRFLFIATAIAALFLAAMSLFPVVLSWMVSASVFAYFIYFVVNTPQHRLSAATLLGCMTFPYVWVIGYDELDRLVPTVFWMIAGFPAFLPGMLMSRFIEAHFTDSYWTSVLLTAIELGVGIWVIQLGPKRTIVYALFAMLCSTMGSLVFHMLVLA